MILYVIRHRPSGQIFPWVKQSTTMIEFHYDKPLMPRLFSSPGRASALLGTYCHGPLRPIFNSAGEYVRPVRDKSRPRPRDAFEILPVTLIYGDPL